MDSLLEHDAEYLRPPWGAYGRDFTLGVVSGFGKLALQVRGSAAGEGALVVAVAVAQACPYVAQPPCVAQPRPPPPISTHEQVLNSTIVAGRSEFHRHVMERQPGVGLLTFSNHTR